MSFAMSRPDTNLDFTKPALVIIPGGFTQPGIYNPFLPLLRSPPYSIEAYALPLQSVGRRPPPVPDMHDDATGIAAEVRKLAERGRKVVVVGHSYGGLPITQCTEGLTVTERTAQGKYGGICRLVYLAASVPRLGDASKEEEFEYVKKKPGDDDVYESFDFDAMKDYLFNDMDPEKARTLGGANGEMSVKAMKDKLTWAGYKDVPSTYIKTLRDIPFPLIRQNQCIEVLKEHAPRGQVDVVEIDCGHVANLSKPEELARILNDIVEKSR